MEVRFNMTWRDRLESYRVGLSQMTLLGCTIWSAFLLLFLGSQLLLRWLQNYSITWPLTQLPPLPSPLSIISHAAASGFGCLIGFILVACFSQLRTVQINPDFLVCKIWRLSNRIRWKNINIILDTGKYICFCQNYPIAVVVPKLAFRGQEQANMFLEEATQHWRKAKGILPPSLPDMPGVWPPAPRPANSAEPGDGLKD